MRSSDFSIAVKKRPQLLSNDMPVIDEDIQNENRASGI